MTLIQAFGSSMIYIQSTKVDLFVPSPKQNDIFEIRKQNIQIQLDHIIFLYEYV